MPAASPAYIISACLCGEACRYDGGAFDYPVFAALAREGKALPVCPELLGGLGVPRPPCEIREGRVFGRDGSDCTEAFHAGAARVLELAKAHGVTTAVLKSRSPSCGSSVIYDGSFTGRTIPGQGITAALLAANGIRVLGEEEAVFVLACEQA